MIKGLYFKLNLDNPRDQEIYDFFNNEKVEGFNNIEQLRALIRCYKYFCKTEQYVDMLDDTLSELLKD